VKRGSGLWLRKREEGLRTTNTKKIPQAAGKKGFPRAALPSQSNFKNSLRNPYRWDEKDRLGKNSKKTTGISESLLGEKGGPSKKMLLPSSKGLFTEKRKMIQKEGPDPFGGKDIRGNLSESRKPYLGSRGQ